MKRIMLTAFVLLISPPAGLPADEVSNSPIGRQVADFTLLDFRGTAHSLGDLEDSQLVVVVFLGTECPLAKLYGPRLEELAQGYKAELVSFLGVNANRHDSLSEIDAYARRHGVTFPILKDTVNKLADAVGAKRTPEVFVLDRHRRIQYHGRIDDQYGVGYSRDKVTRLDLKIAIDELLAGKIVTVPSTAAVGCHIGRIVKPDNDSPVTYSNQVSRIFQKHCVECHRNGEIAPFPLTDYDEVVGWAETIAEVIELQRMPPWHANPEFGHFSNQRLMTSGEKQLVYEWVAAGAPEGDRSTLPSPRSFLEGWRLPHEPDLVFEMHTKPFVVAAGGTVEYQYFVVDPGFTRDTWIRAAEVVAGNREVVHHAIVFVRPPNLDPSQGMGFLTAYVPGQTNLMLPEGQAKLIPAGSHLVFQMHYTPNGSEQQDNTKIGLILADPDLVTEQLITVMAINRDFEIPPEADNHRVSKVINRFPEGSRLLSLSPHMHLRGKSMQFRLREKGQESIMLDVPNYDFNWQHTYLLEEPLDLKDGMSIEVIGHFDNSDNNLVNPDSSAVVRWGDQTWEEMMIGFMEIAVPVDPNNLGRIFEDKPLSDNEEQQAVTLAKDLIRRFDRDGNGTVERAEVPDAFAVFAFRDMDGNGDKRITEREALDASRESVRQLKRRRLNR
jgi:peroxiredoxin